MFHSWSWLWMEYVTSTWGNSLSQPTDKEKEINKQTSQRRNHLFGVTVTLKKSEKCIVKKKQLVRSVNHSSCIASCKVKMFALHFSVASLPLFMFQCRLTVIWRLQMGFLRRTMLPLMASPSHTLSGLSSMKRVCFQCVGLKRK